MTTTGRWRRARAALDALGGVVLLVPTIVAAPFLRHAYNRWGTTKGEGRSHLAGDELIPEPKLSHTRAISIDAPPARVWRWLVQIGQGRGGLYSYDALENLIGCRIDSAERIVPELQHLAVGDLVRLGPERYPAFRVVELEPARSLVLVGVDPTTHAAATDAGGRRHHDRDDVGLGAATEGSGQVHPPGDPTTVDVPGRNLDAVASPRADRLRDGAAHALRHQASSRARP